MTPHAHVCLCGQKVVAMRRFQGSLGELRRLREDNAELRARLEDPGHETLARRQP